MSVRRSGVLRLVDTRRGSPKGHYVNPPTPGFSRMPKERRSRRPLPLRRQRRLAGRPGDRPQPGTLDRAHRSGRAGGDHQDPPTTLLLYGRTVHPLGAPPHFTSSPALALGNPVQWRPRTIASPSISSLTARLAPAHPLDFPTASKTRAKSVPERLRSHAALTISPTTTTTGRRHTLGVATAPCTQPYLLESKPPRFFPLPRIPCLTGMATSLRWIWAKVSRAAAKRTTGVSTTGAEQNCTTGVMPDGHGLAGWAGGVAWSGAGAGLGRTLIGGRPVRRWR